MVCLQGQWSSLPPALPLRPGSLGEPRGQHHQLDWVWPSPTGLSFTLKVQSLGSALGCHRSTVPGPRGQAGPPVFSLSVKKLYSGWMGVHVDGHMGT